MEEKKAPFKVVIIGGSVAGLTLANMLQLNDIDFVILEAYPKIAPQVGASIGILPHGARILDQLGLYQPILALAPPVERFNFRNSKGEPIAGHSGMRRSFEERHGYPIMFLDRQMVLQVLYDNIKDKSKVLTEKRLEKVDLHEKGVSVTCTDGSTFSGDFVVGGDGIHSTTRSEMWRIAGEKSPGYFPPAEHNDVPCDYSCIFGIVNPIKGFEPGNLHSIFREKTSYLVNGGPEGRVYYFFFFKHEKTLYGSDIPRYTNEEKLKIFKEHENDPLTPEITFGDLQKKEIISILTPLPEYVYKKWHYDRIICIGDSSHKYHPIAGHGGNAAIETAAAFTNALVKGLKANGGSLSTPQLSEIFEGVQNLRDARTRHLCKASHDQQLVEAMDSGLHKFIALTILPMTDSEDVMFNFSGNLPAAEKLDMVELPPRARLIPFKDELAADPKPRGVVGYVQMAIYIAIGLVGYYGMWTRTAKYGLNEQLESVLDTGAFHMFEGSPALKQSYTGIGGIDSFLSILSAFFTPGIAGFDKALGNLYLYFLGGLVSPIAVYLIEACRKRNDMNLLALPMIWLGLSQLFGIGIVIPWYYTLYTVFSNAEPYWWPLSRLVPAHYIRVLLPSLMIGFILPTILMVIPWSSPSTTQTFIALWQPSPLYACLLTFLLSILHKKLSPPKDSLTPFAAATPKDIPFLKLIYVLVFVLNTALHFFVLSRIISSPTLSLSSTFLFSDLSITSLGPAGLPELLRNSIAADFWAFTVASYVWCVNAVWDIKRMGRTTADVGIAAVLILGLNVVVGPGAAMAMVWYWREMCMAKTSVARK